MKAPPAHIRILLVEESPLLRDELARLLASDPALHVAGAVADSAAALAFVAREPPSLVLIGTCLKGLGGLALTSELMATAPLPIVIVAGGNQAADVALSFQAIQAGALAVVRRPAAGHDPAHGRQARELLQTVKAMAGVRVIRRRRPGGTLAAAVAVPAMSAVPAGVPPPVAGPPGLPGDGAPAAARIRLVAIGCSTGGPQALAAILTALPGDFPLPILVVQHIASGFTQGLADWLDRTTALHAVVAGHHDRVRPGHVYLAPEDRHMGIEADGRLVMSQALPEHFARPAVSYLFRSVGQAYGAGVLAMLLTGMGRDGAAELKALRDLGAVTIAQDEASSVVHGMPREAIRLGGAVLVLPLGDIAPAVVRLVRAGDAGSQPRSSRGSLP